jgi:thiol-disulfide isomerase/thioredoxin
MRLVSFAASLCCLVALDASAASLSVGDDAPAITVSKFVKGERIDRLEPGRTYVVEFWATWCGPCRATIPHLTELQKKFKDRGVRFIGVSIWEQDQEKVEPFVKEMGDKMDYSVALDEMPGKEKVVAGTWDIEAAASQRREAKAQQRKLMKLSQDLNKRIQANEFKEAVALLDKAIDEDAKLEPQLGRIKFHLLLRSEDYKKASLYGNRLVDAVFHDDENNLNEIAWSIVAPESKVDSAQRDLKLALKAALRANDLAHGENGGILDTLAKVHFDSGDPVKAFELQKKAVQLVGNNAVQEMKDRLEQYRKAAEAKGR